jgi:hypothetical protein
MRGVRNFDGEVCFQPLTVGRAHGVHCLPTKRDMNVIALVTNELLRSSVDGDTVMLTSCWIPWRINARASPAKAKIREMGAAKRSKSAESVTFIKAEMSLVFPATTIFANLATSAGTSLPMSRRGIVAVAIPPDAERTRPRKGVVDAEEAPLFRRSRESEPGNIIELARIGERESRSAGGFGGGRTGLISGVEAAGPITSDLCTRPSLRCFDFVSFAL